MSYDLSRIAFIGLGTMGMPMAENLARKLPSSKIYAYDVVQTMINKLHDSYPEQVVCCHSAIEAVSSASVVLTMVPEGKHVRQLYLDAEQGLINTDLACKLIIDCSTIDPASSIAVRDALADKYSTASFYDAPVSGGSTGAVNGTLTFMLGSSESDPNLSTLKEILGLMGSNVTACGGHSLGLTAKLCNNYCSGMIALATAETFNIAARSGLNPKTLHQIFQSSTAGSCINEKWNPVPGVVSDAPSSHGYKPGFKIELMAKDMGLAIDLAEKVGARLVLAEKGMEVYHAAAQDEACRGLDSRVVYRWIGGVENWNSRAKDSE